MKRQKKQSTKLLSLALSAAMVCAMLPMTTFAAERTADKRTIGLDVREGFIIDKNGGSITPENGVYDMISAEGWKWDTKTNTLTLNGLNVGAADRCAVLIPANTTIELIGDNFAASGNSIGLQMDGNGSLNIIGTGSLDIDSRYAGIVSYGDTTITGGTIDITSEIEAAIWVQKGALEIGGSADLDATGYRCGLLADGITLSGGTLDLVSETSNAIYTPGDITVSGGDITAQGKGDYPAVWADTDITVTGGKLHTTSAVSNGIGASRNLSVSGAADVTAIGGSYPGMYAYNSLSISGGKVAASTSNAGDGIWCDGSVDISGGVVNASSADGAGIFSKGTFAISGTADVTVAGTNSGGMVSNGNMTISGGKVDASGDDGHSIYTDAVLTISGTADVEARNTSTSEGYSALLSYGDMAVNGGKVNAVSAAGNAIYTYGAFTAAKDTEITADGGWAALYAANNMTLNGKLEAAGDDSTAIMAGGTITVGTDADVTASSVSGGGMFGTRGITSTGIIDAVGGGNAGIISYGPINLTSGTVHAKGGAGKAAIFTYFTQNSGEEAVSGIALGDLIEKNGGKVNFSGWVDHNGGNKKNWTTFIAGDDTKLNTMPDGNMDNSLTEITLAAPHTVTFDVNGGDGKTSTAKVYPGNKVSAPDTSPTKDGGHFSGWYPEGSSTAFDFANAAITADTTLQAKFDAHTSHADDGDCATATTCSVCESVITAAKTHDWNTAWMSDSSGHWHLCNNAGCTQVNAKAAHTPGEAATINHPQVCIACGYEITPKLLSQGVIVDDSTGTKVEYEDGSAFDASIVLRVTSKPQAEMDHFKDAVDRAAPGLVLGELYDVKLLKDGVAIQPDGKVKVSIPLTDAMKAMTGLKVVCIDDNGAVTIIPSEVNDGMIVFVTDHFSHYGVIGKMNAAAPVTPGDNPQTGDNALIFPITLMAFASCALLVTLSKKRKYLVNE